ncbi:hypothetical protein [Streptomyces sp. NPDC060194]|uniref:hypothetical protein n=1 Tax=Streptomyces sp. NPDC060194 TaxID=3347069 RepID=UPI00364BB604
MGSLRNPIGPLPSSIYWRRRAVLLSVIAVVALLVVWLVTSGDDGKDDGADGPGGRGPTSSITPGPTDSQPPISEAPGGREESDGGASDGGSGGGGAGADGGTGNGGASGGGSGSGGADDSGGAGGGDASGGSAGGVGGAGGSGGSGSEVPVGSTLPDCTSGTVKLSLRSVRNTYEPDEKPKLELVASNASDQSCKMDFGPKEAVVEITRADTDDLLWSSADCPKNPAARLLRVSAKTSVTHTVTWDRTTSEPNCATPRPGSVAQGETYLVEVKAPGLPGAKTSFVLEKD